jgi:squalene synthase HpnC
MVSTLAGTGAVPNQPGLGVARRAENFPLAWLCGPRRRRQRLAVYAFCRLVDDLGDEYRGDVAAALDWAEGELRAAGRSKATHPTFVALTPLFAAGLPLAPFLRLIEANRLDQEKHEYRSWEELDAYCALSAAPVGEIVLRLEGIDDPRALALSASICAGLQFVNHWQDLAEDAARGRCYVPHPVLARHGIDREQLARRQGSPAIDGLVAECVREARLRLAAGWPLVGRVSGRLRLEVAGFVAHGGATAEAVARAGASGLRERPTASAHDRLLAVVAALRGLRRPDQPPRFLCGSP